MGFNYLIGGREVKLSTAISVLLTSAILVLSAGASAQEHPCGPGAIPYEGAWSTQDATLDGGRASEGWCGAVLMPGQPGNTLAAMSWDGSVLGQAWMFYGMTIGPDGAVETGRSIDPTGFGWIDYETDYTGGNFWLVGTGDWSDGTNLTGTVTLCNVGARVTYVANTPVGVTSNIRIIGVFDQCDRCSVDIVANASRVWMTGGGARPADYPPFQCETTEGELHDICCGTLTIYCEEVAVDRSTWGAIKQMMK